MIRIANAQVTTTVVHFQKRSKRENVHTAWTQSRTSFFPGPPPVGVNFNFSLCPLLTTRMNGKRERCNARARQPVAGGALRKKQERRHANGAIGGGVYRASIAVIPKEMRGEGMNDLNVCFGLRRAGQSC